MALVSEIGEFGLIDRLATLGIVRGIGDDCAVLTPPPGMDLVITADALIEGVHFRHEWTDWRQLGWKSVAVNLSDIAAMAAEPAGVLITLGLKPRTTVEEVMAFYAGAAAVLGNCSEGAAIVGGDIVAAPGATAISVTAYGFVPTGQAVSRGGARPGDELWVTGYLGDSAAALRLMGGKTRTGSVLQNQHNVPTPRVREALAAAGTGRLHAMLDISDGLAGDLRHMATMSRVGAVIDEEALPLSMELVIESTANGWDKIDLALHGGEDYELLMAVEPGGGEALKDAISDVSSAIVSRVGTVTCGTDLLTRRPDGTTAPLAAKAFEHF